jgi:hypothetical protein
MSYETQQVPKTVFETAYFIKCDGCGCLDSCLPLPPNWSRLRVRHGKEVEQQTFDICDDCTGIALERLGLR